VPVELRPLARTDIAHIHDQGTALFGRLAADAYLLDLFDALDLLGRTPLMARERTELSLPVRIYSFRSHVIVYLARGDVAEVLRVRHGREDWLRELQEDG
jgi:toxin ParE1/3/4